MICKMFLGIAMAWLAQACVDGSSADKDAGQGGFSGAESTDASGGQGGTGGDATTRGHLEELQQNFVDLRFGMGRAT